MRFVFLKSDTSVDTGKWIPDPFKCQTSVNADAWCKQRAVKPAVSVAVSVSVNCFSCRDDSRQIYIAVGHFRDT